MSDHAAARAGLVRSLQRTGIRDRRVLGAIGRVPRERFVPPDLADAAYEDRALPIGEGQTISQPWVVARMTELLDVAPAHRVLELGTGSGYQAAVLAELAAEVVSAERHASLADGAAALLAELGYTNVRVVHTDASAGLTEWAPYDRIIITAATPSIDPALVAQCRPDGRIVAPVGGPDHQELVVRRPDGSEKRYGAVKFVPLLGRGGFRGE